VDRYPLKKYPIVGVCGLNCGLCPRYHTAGPSRCPGCCGAGFWQKHPACGFITCCVKNKGLETCTECLDFDDCERVAGVLDSTKQRDSFISYRPVPANFSLIRERGIKEFARLEMAKQEFLEYLLANYDEGRSKSFYCTSSQLVPLNRLKEALKEAEAEITRDTPLKEKARALRALISRMADGLGIDLKLRK
jgi:hypothetical protein